MLQDVRSRARFALRLLNVSADLILPAIHYDPGVDSASNRNEYQESSLGGKRRLARKADNLNATCESRLSRKYEKKMAGWFII
jgi:hypothetical protein